MCITLFTNSVGPIFLYLSKQLNVDYIIINVLYMIQHKCIMLCVSKVMVLYIFNTNFK